MVSLKSDVSDTIGFVCSKYFEISCNAQHLGYTMGLKSPRKKILKRENVPTIFNG